MEFQQKSRAVQRENGFCWCHLLCIEIQSNKLLKLQLSLHWKSYFKTILLLYVFYFFHTQTHEKHQGHMDLIKMQFVPVFPSTLAVYSLSDVITLAINLISPTTLSMSQIKLWLLKISVEFLIVWACPGKRTPHKPLYFSALSGLWPFAKDFQSGQLVMHGTMVAWMTNRSLQSLTSMNMASRIQL